MDFQNFFKIAEESLKTGNPEILNTFEPKKEILREPVKKLFIRSAILVSGDKIKHLKKIVERDVDIIIFNLEDGVSDKNKPIARKILKIFLSNINPENKQIVVRLNPIDSSFFFDDICEILPAIPHGIRLSKVETPEDVIALDKIITAFEKKIGIRENTIKIHLSIETGKSIQNLKEILQSSKRIETAYLGILDLFSDLKLPQSAIKTSPTAKFLKANFVTTCRSYNVYPVAPAYQNYKDLEGFEKECMEDKIIGFSGKSCISIKQTEIANLIFSPSEEEIEKARKIVELYKKAEEKGEGGITFNGLFIDQPIYKDALNILKLSGTLNEI
ncbi:HpcH/HpaI aldolase/citrate lyase family protein [Desulfurobacterium atlanticum]|uniref:Citrate lyase subunit beta / citryl-CoA lyase n=1 Tax=Desulfurobacterium atlanticum TaxID=240169 RepID=A0A238YAI6_9BACT|nr:CoA ester lyase [Desulfurobacterium atlanticum]SNR68276.1 citrate lyase subunit beta / citryl-CoA lyase [Desulfurobacterium atlanticum]